MNNLVNNINKVYGMLEDDLSRKVFNARLDYILNNKYDEFSECLEGDNYEMHNLTNKLNIFTSNFSSNETVIIYGAGARGRWNYGKIKQLNYNIKCIFCDSNYDKYADDNFFSEKVISPNDLLVNYKDCKVIISVAEKKYFLEILKFLQDNKINQILAGIICSYTQYFDNIIKLNADEIFIDAGVLNGQTSLDFAKKCNNKYKKIYLFEADKSFENNIKDNILELHNTELHMKGLWNKEETISFMELDGGSGNISDQGTTSIDVDTLDNMLKGQEATFIKMDIEGAELNALIGSKETIKKYKPKLAICVYHKNEDILSIPLYIKELVPEYKFYMRHYSNGNTETVLYAIVD